MTSLFSCCAGSRRRKRLKASISAPVSTVSTPLSKPPNGQRIIHIHDSVALADSLEDFSAQPPINKRALPRTPVAVIKMDSLGKINASGGGQQSDAVNGGRFGHCASGPKSSDLWGVTRPDDDDYDNTGAEDEAPAADSNRPSLTTFSRSSAGSVGAAGVTSPTSCDEQSLDNLVAHLLASVSSTDENQNSRKHPPMNYSKPSELPNSERSTPDYAAVATSDDSLSNDYDVPKGTAVMNDNVFQNHKSPGNTVDQKLASRDNDDYDVPRPPHITSDVSVGAAAEIINSVVVKTNHEHTPKIVIHENTAMKVDELKRAPEPAADLSQTKNCDTVLPKSGIISNESTNADISAMENGNVTNSQQSNCCGQYTSSTLAPPVVQTDLVPTPQGSSEINTSKTPESMSPVSSADSREWQEPLMDQFKALRLEILTSTSQLLSCVSGTWKRGDDCQSKLISIKPLCQALATSLMKFEKFVQLLATKAAEIDRWQLHDSLNAQISALNGVQDGVDVYIDGLDAVSADADQQGMKVGTIVHLTKEIPILVRTFVPLIELVAHYNEVKSPSTSPQTEAVQSVATQNDAIQNETREEQNKKNDTETVENQSTNVAKSENVDIPSNNTDETIANNFPETNNDARKNSSDEVFVNNSVADELPPKTAAVNVTECANDTVVSTVCTTANVADGDDNQPPPSLPPKQRTSLAYRASVGLADNLDILQSRAADSQDQVTKRDEDDLDCSIPSPDQTSEPRSTNSGQPISHSNQAMTGITLDDIASEGSSASHPILSANNSMTDYRNYYQPVVLRKSVTQPPTDSSGVAASLERFRISQSELKTPEIRASGISQTMVDQLEELQREANAQNVCVHTDTFAEYANFDVNDKEASSFVQQSSRLGDDDRRLLLFYCDQMTSNWNVLDNAASAFFNCMDRRQPPKVFVMHSKFVILAGHKMAYIGDILAKTLIDDNARDWVVSYSNRLCNSLKLAVRVTKEAALSYPAVPPQQHMVDSIKEITDWAIELKEVIDRLTYIGRPDHVLA